jgi:flavin-dependent dehydrogenase
VETCDVVIVGGGPSGSACAWKLRQAGLDVVIVDKAIFPRDKVCAGWITPQVLDELRIETDDYCEQRTLQPISGFRIGMIDDADAVNVSYDRVVSFGIRRREFDEYLLRRSGARLQLGHCVSGIRRSRSGWMVDGVSAPMLVGAGGHFCPVARMLNQPADHGPIVVAQEVELPLDRHAFCVSGERPELYFSPDVAGYGWCFRKADYVNVGFGQLDAHALPQRRAQFVDFLRATGRLAADPSAWRWQGHAYEVAGTSGRHLVGDAVIVAGDAGGLAYPQSGEGIRPAVESGLLAASIIVEANGDYSRDRLEPYAGRMGRRFRVGPSAHVLSRLVPDTVSTRAWTVLTPWLLARPWFVRHVVLDRWFLHRREAAIAAA